MNPGEWIAASLGILTILTILAHMTRLLYRLARSWEQQQESTADLKADVAELKATFNNGIRTEIASAATNAKEAATQATRANQLAGEAATRAAVAVQVAEDASRAVNALRAEVDVYTNVVIEDRSHLRRKMRELGADLSDLD